MAATWVDAEAASNMRPCQGIDPSKLKNENQQGNNNKKNPYNNYAYSIVTSENLPDQLSDFMHPSVPIVCHI